MNILTRDSFFLTPPDLARESVDVPEMGGSVFVRAMTAGERDRYERDQFPEGKNSGHDLRARLAAYTVCDPDGALLFTPADVPRLSALPAGPLSRIADAAMRLNKIGADAEAAVEKNSEPIPSDASA